MIFLIWIIQWLFIPVAAPLGVGIIRKLKAKLQNRQGAGIFQPYSDLWKLFHKDEVISADASAIFNWAPFIVFAVTVVVGASVPVFFLFSPFPVVGDMLTIIYLLAISTFFLALAGMDTGGAFGGFGSSREMTMSALAEGGFIFSLLTAAVVSGHTNLFAISNVISSSGWQFIFPILLSFLGFFIVLLAEAKRFPFDNPATHLELTMIHEAMILEYSGKRLALMEWAAAAKLLIFISLAINLFFPWGIASVSSLGAIFGSLMFFAAKALIFYMIIAVIESSMAKLRFFRLPDLLIISFIINCIAISLIM